MDKINSPPAIQSGLRQQSLSEIKNLLNIQLVTASIIAEKRTRFIQFCLKTPISTLLSLSPNFVVRLCKAELEQVVKHNDQILGLVY
jgi:hypothetical protein